MGSAHRSAPKNQTITKHPTKAKKIALTKNTTDRFVSRLSHIINALRFVKQCQELSELAAK